MTLGYDDDTNEIVIAVNEKEKRILEEMAYKYTLGTDMRINYKQRIAYLIADGIEQYSIDQYGKSFYDDEENRCDS